MIIKVLGKKDIKKKSSPVTDIETQVIPHIDDMAELCRRKTADNRRGLAIAHCQMEKENPLTFFVMACGDAIINPKIISVVEKTEFLHSECCMSFPNREPVKVKRYNRIKVEYTLYTGNRDKSQYVEKTVSGIFALILQHEIDHFDLKYIYD
jgi:peptide deformylase